MNGLLIIAFISGEAIGALLMLVSIFFVAKKWGTEVSAGELSFFNKVSAKNLSQATVIFLVGAAFAGVPIGFVLRGASDAEASTSPSTTVKLDADLITASASSAHPTDHGITYSARNTLDSNRNSAWNADGPGIGEQLHYEFAQPVKVTQIGLVNGYAKDQTTFTRNARLRQVTLITDEKTLSRRLKDTLRWQAITEDFGVTSSLTIEIESIYEGSLSDWNDAALTEISFWGTLERNPG